jgi:hypothetical protein
MLIEEHQQFPSFISLVCLQSSLNSLLFLMHFQLFVAFFIVILFISCFATICYEVDSLSTLSLPLFFTKAAFFIVSHE